MGSSRVRRRKGQGAENGKQNGNQLVGKRKKRRTNNAKERGRLPKGDADKEAKEVCPRGPAAGSCLDSVTAAGSPSEVDAQRKMQLKIRRKAVPEGPLLDPV